MHLSVHWSLLTWSFKEDISISLFLIPPCLRRPGPPLSFKLPSLLIYKGSWYRFFFFFFPLNFLVLISVFYDFDCLLRLRVSPRQPWSQPLRARRTGGRARFLRTACLHLDMHHRRRKSGRWTLMSCGRTSCGECVVAGRWGVGRKENQVLTTYLTDQVLFQLFTEISVVLKCFPA